MSAEYVVPFLASAREVFRTMIATEISNGEPRLESTVEGSNVILAIIGMSGELRGAVAVAFPYTTAINIANQVLGTTKTDVDADVVDAVAEVTNMIAGGAKAQLSRVDGPPVQLGLPVVIRDTHASLDNLSRSKWVVMPFSSGMGEFTVHVSFENRISK
ncbi:MAG: hypothetical protein AMXMBFR84_17100 [Candidatus Hydrogenedentota bacterium]